MILSFPLVRPIFSLNSNDFLIFTAISLGSNDVIKQPKVSPTNHYTSPTSVETIGQIQAIASLITLGLPSHLLVKIITSEAL